jgi:hypothetical protein
VSMPLAIYLYFRSLRNVRPYRPHFSMLWQTPEFLGTALRAAWEQYSLVGLLALIAIPWLWWRKQRLFVAANVFVAATCFLFFNLDDAQFIGLARWGLLTYVPLLAILARGVGELLKYRSTPKVQAAAGAVAAATLVFNVVQCPVAMDGSLPDHWGFYRIADGEVFYPFDKMFQWLSANVPPQPMVLAGHLPKRLPEPGVHYCGWRAPLTPLKKPDSDQNPADSTQMLLAVQQSRLSGVRYIVWGTTSSHFDAAEVGQVEGLKYLRHFSNARHCLALFEVR